MGCIYICRICKECGKILPIIAFGTRKTGKYGRQSKCLECMKNKRKKYKKICQYCGKEYKTEHKDSIYCSNKCSASNKAKTHEQFINELKNINADMEILGEYININTPIKCKCKKHNLIYYASPSNLLLGSGCKQCGFEKISNNKRKTHEQFTTELLNINPDIELIDKYNKDNINIVVRCKKCGNIWNTSPSNLLQGHGCKQCYLKNNKGENNPNYNHNLTEEERIMGRKYIEYYEWRKQVYERDNYTCQCCNKHGGRLVAHHLNGYHWDKEHRTDVNNGVTLCEQCHKEFHNQYGLKNNIKQQYEDFIENKNRKIS